MIWLGVVGLICSFKIFFSSFLSRFMFFTSKISTKNCTLSGIGLLLEQFKILASYHDKVKLRLAEAILIRDEKPDINVKFNEMSNFINLYK